ncbi:MAG: hypothetical protein P8Z68_04075 [Kineosporiaceae bacterium]
MSEDQTVTIHHPGGALGTPVIPATVGGSGVDTSALLRSTGYVALDPGFVNTASCTSEIT